MAVKEVIYRAIHSIHPVMRFPTGPVSVTKAARSSRDNVRFEAVALAAATIEREAIVGAFAEVGVFRGATSRFLHKCAPDRKLYLFDSFQGFPREVVGSQELANKGDRFRFKDTSVEIVRAAVGASRNISIRSGVFPETTTGLEAETFAFVMLDLDIYAPTLAALEFFHPRLSKGAYVFVHDFNSPESDHAMQRAVSFFLADKLERPIELPDEWGTAVYRKI